MGKHLHCYQRVERQKTKKPAKIQGFGIVVERRGFEPG
jgi:hypothetical protein